MESRAFIKAATVLVAKIKDAEAISGIASPEDIRQARQENQKELNVMFNGLQNPTLPSAYKLRDVALEHGYQIEPKHLARIRELEFVG